MVGRSGSGKSTMLALLQRQYDTSYGVITIDDADISDVEPRQPGLGDFGGRQDVQLFHRSVMENIRYGRAGCER